MAFDGIVTKAIASELQQLSGARIDKIFQPNKNNIILGFYFNKTNYALNICTNPSNYRIHLTTHPKKNPQVAPNFCMVLRKHLIGLHIKNIITDSLERVITIEFEGFDDIDDIISKKLIIELMGKHCNVVLLDDENIIIDSLKHINNENTLRTIMPHIKYTYPTTQKRNFLECTDFEEFIKNVDIKDFTTFVDSFSNIYNGISKKFINQIINKLNITTLTTDTAKEIYTYINKIIANTDSLNLNFEIDNSNNNSKNDYFLIVQDNDELFNLNFFIDDFYYDKETNEEFINYRNSILKLILNELKKYKKRLFNINNKLQNCENMDIYKVYGELLTANLYRIKDENISSIELENYYENNNLTSIPLDIKYTPSINAKRYFKKYNKLKNELKIVTIQKEETQRELSYIESIVYELEASSTIEEIASIFEEISENVIFKDKISYKNKNNSKIKKSKLTKNKNISFNPLKYTIDGYTLLVGRNNKGNDYLTLKYAKKTDLWFHTKDIHGSHAILLLNNKTPDTDILIKCAQITAYHSKARNSSNVPVDFCEAKYVKKPNGAKPGMVIYTNNQTLNVNPKIK
mgnify:FL=1